MTGMAEALRRGMLFTAQAAHRLPLGPRLRARLDKNWRTLANRRMLAADCARVPAILEALPAHLGIQTDAWRVQGAHWTEGNVAVIRVGPNGQDPAVFLKLPHTAAGETSLRHEHSVLRTLQHHPALVAWRELMPAPIHAGTLGGRCYNVESALPGCNMREILRGPLIPVHGYSCAALSAIAELHRGTARPILVDAVTLDRWIGRPLRSLMPMTPSKSAITRLGQELRTALDGQTVAVGWIHGDFWAGNVLVASDSLTIRGIVDWDLAVPNELPIHDLLNFVLSAEWLRQGGEMGDAMCRWLNQRAPNGLMEGERSLIANLIPSLFGDPSGQRAMLLLYWLRYVTTYLEKVPYRARDGWWMNRNVEGVLRAL